MKFSLNLVDWQAKAPGLSDAERWLAWSRQPQAIDPNAAPAKPSELPMMTARRLSSGSKLAVDCGLALLRRCQIDAVLYTSRHGELERNYSILQALATKQPVSPTDFTMSVHNSAAANLTIVAGQALICSSLSAGVDTFQQGLLEVMCLLQAGHRRVLMVDFDGQLPAFYHPWLTPEISVWAYAVALVLEAGTALQCQAQSRSDSAGGAPTLPQSLQFLQHYLSAKRAFVIDGDRLQWRWQLT